MKKLTALFLFLSLATLAAGQTLDQIEAKLNNPATSKPERLSLAYLLAEKYLSMNAGKSADFAHRASMLASELHDNRREVTATTLCGDAHLKRKNSSEAIARYTRAAELAKSYNLPGEGLAALGKLQDLAVKNGNYRDAYKWSSEAINLLRGSVGNPRAASGGGTYQSQLEQKITVLETENRKFREALAQATGRTELLETNYRETEAALKEAQEKGEAELGKSQTQLAVVSEQKERADSLVRKKDQLVLTLTKEQMADSLLLAKREVELETQKKVAAQAQLDKKISENLRNLLAATAAIVFLLALLFYFRYRANKREARNLMTINAEIEEQKKRSDALLLNILPPIIADELKLRQKVAPRQYPNATVMFIDFKGFTTVAEHLTPELLVEEIDYCFSNFDRIIGQFRIEKIKTIGDAYMCASGLSDKNASPSDMVKAALEIQDFLQHLKAERLSRGLPFFEARIGIHNGPVVAGVVGTKKFAYDIWGDTVNIAARMEETCEPGRVNVSESAYWLAKYEFDWQHRGKVSAKNKGMIDMYYVQSILPAA